MSVINLINTTNLKIARENMGMSSLTASKRISSSAKDVVAEWERGDSLPTWSQVTKLSKIYNVPELLFFSDKPLEKQKVIPDYRVGVNQESDEKIKKLINLVVTRQKWLERCLKEGGSTQNQLQGSGRNLESPRQLADLIREKLKVDITEFKKISGRKDALNYLIEKAETQGTFVGKTVSYHQIEVEDMRGLFISHDYCPFIILNRRDARAAQIFSFVHELAHYFRRSDAISNTLDFRSTSGNINPEERFCNKVAAELLLPENEFTKVFYDKLDIDAVSDLYKVSKIFIFYRLKELGKIRKGSERALEDEIQKEMQENLRMKAEREKAQSGGNYTNAMRDSNGSLFNRIVYKSYTENKIGYVEASNLLRFSPDMV